MSYNLITILGPTAVGKTKLAAQLANNLNGEIISADSRQVYKGMDIGTGKDLQDYSVENSTVPYHLIDIVSPLEEFDLYKFTKQFYELYEDIIGREKTPFFVGGTGLYLHAILKNYQLPDVDFDSNRANELQELAYIELENLVKEKLQSPHNTTDLLDKERMIKAILIAESEKTRPQNTHISSLNIGIRMERDKIKKRITARLKERLGNGMIEEIEELITSGVSHNKLQFFGLEYKYISLFLQDKLNYNDMYQKLNSAIHNFAKRQMTWFRKMEREGIKIYWIQGPDVSKAKSIIDEKYFGKSE